MDKTLVTVCSDCIGQVLQTPIHLLFGFVLSTLIGVSVLLYLSLFLIAPQPRPPQASEKLYRTLSEDGTTTEPRQLPCWLDRKAEREGKGTGKETGKETSNHTIEPPELFMSVVIPAYNEQDRLVGMLEEAVNYLENEYGTMGERATSKQNPLRRRANGRAGGTEDSLPTDSTKGWEILLIDDGSTDATVETAISFSRTHQLPLRPRRLSGPWTHRGDYAVNIPAGSIRLVSLAKNRGKGGAVIHGMRHARGQYVVFADADGASKFDDLGKLVRACRKVEDAEGRGVAVGSRAHLVGSEAVVKRSKLRNFLMHSFHLLLKWMTPPKTAAIADTQCGFKLFSRPSLPYIVPHMHTEGWIFDVEMLMLSEFAGIPVVEVPVGWKEVLGSKLNVIWDSVGMAVGLALLRLCWGLGIYRRT